MRISYIAFGANCPILAIRKAATRRVRPLLCLLSRQQIPAENRLILLLARLFPAALTGQGFFHPLLFTRFQVEAVALYFLNDVLLLDLPFEAAQGILQRLALLQFHFGHEKTPPNSSSGTALGYQNFSFAENCTCRGIYELCACMNSEFSTYRAG